MQSYFIYSRIFILSVIQKKGPSDEGHVTTKPLVVDDRYINNKNKKENSEKRYQTAAARSAEGNNTNKRALSMQFSEASNDQEGESSSVTVAMSCNSRHSSKPIP